MGSDLKKKLAYMPSAKSDDYGTPDRVFVEASVIVGKNVRKFFDPCPLNPTFDGLKVKWKKYNFINPPYSNLPLWVEKAYTEYFNYNKVCVLLLPLKTDQMWFHSYCKGFKIHYFQGRLKFKGAKWSATQPHMLVIMDGRKI